MKPRVLNERDLRALRIFCVAAQAGGFSAAENKLNMTKTTISRQIKSVEETLGAKLCSRGPQGFELTEAGKRPRWFTPKRRWMHSIVFSRL